MSTPATKGTATENPNGVSFFPLLGMVIGSTVASAVFSFSGDFAAAGAGTGAVLVGWLVTGAGMLGLCLAFYYLSMLRPDLTGGVYSYAKEGFGSYIGFSSAWGYWLSEMLSNIAFLTLLFAALSNFFPIFGTGNNIPAVIGMSLLLWAVTALILKGVKEAAVVNLIATIAKLAPIMMFIVFVIVAQKFSWEIFMENFFTEPGGMSFGEQVMKTTTTTVWAFTGIEGAMVISGRAKKASDVGRSTVIGFLCVLVLYLIISCMGMGILSRSELALLGNPPLAGIMSEVVGSWGATFINIAVIISLTGALLGHTIMCVECPFDASNKFGAFCKAFGKTNKSGAPIFTTLLTSAIAQFFLVLCYFNDATYQVFYFFATGVIMIPYFLSAMFFLKVALKQDSAKIKGIAIFTAIYSVWMLYASGVSVVMAGVLIFAPGIFVFAKGQKEKQLPLFEEKIDRNGFIGMMILLAITLVLVANGTVAPLG